MIHRAPVFSAFLAILIAAGTPGCEVEDGDFEDFEDFEAEFDEEAFARSQGPAAKEFSGGFGSQGWERGYENFSLDGAGGLSCLSVPTSAFPNPPPNAGDVCTASGCTPHPHVADCFVCTTLVCNPPGSAVDATKEGSSTR